MKPLVIYHGNCADGFGAAWSIWNLFGDEIDFQAGKYGDPPPNVAGRRVMIVDFSYKRPVLEAMAKEADGIIILDHHKTAAEDLRGFPLPPDFRHGQWLAGGAQQPIYALFDMARSGAGITWDYVTNNLQRPPLLNHIEDRDLWRFALPKTREINAALFSYPYDFQVWSGLMAGRNVSLEGLIKEGEAIERKHVKDINELLPVTQRFMTIGKIRMPVANLPYTFSSDAGQVMAKGHPSKAAACYWDTSGGRVFSLRSTEDGPDVSAIASLYGGGGHAHASGFKAEAGWEGE